MQPPNPLEEQCQALFRRHRAGDTQALNELATVLSPVVFAYLHTRVTADRETIEDLTQEAVFQIVRKIDEYEPQSRFLPWAFTVANHRAIDLLRRKRLPMAATSAEEPGRRIPAAPISLIPRRSAKLTPRPDQAERLNAMRDCLAELKPEFRAVMVLRSQGVKFVDIARSLGIRPGTAASRSGRGLILLRECFATKVSEGQFPELCIASTEPKPVMGQNAWSTGVALRRTKDFHEQESSQRRRAAWPTWCQADFWRQVAEASTLVKYWQRAFDACPTETRFLAARQNNSWRPTEQKHIFEDRCAFCAKALDMLDRLEAEERPPLEIAPDGAGLTHTARTNPRALPGQLRPWLPGYLRRNGCDAGLTEQFLKHIA